MGDKITRPDHYCEGREYEPKDVIRDWGLNFNIGSAVKYISRAGRKGDKLEDLKKAKQFLEFEIEAEEKGTVASYATFSDEYVNSNIETFVSAVLDGNLDIDDNFESDETRKKIINHIVEMIDKGDLDYIDIPLHLSRKYLYQNIPDGYKARVINRIAQQVLDSQIIPPDEVRAAVIDRIVERIDNDELDCFDISYNLYYGYREIRDALERQALRKVGEKQKSDIGMTCKEAAEIGKAMDKGFEEGLKEAQSKNDVTCGLVCTCDVLNDRMKFEDVPEVLKPLVFKGVADEVMNGMVDISSDILSDELREKIIDYAIEKLENGDLSPFDLPTYIMDHPKMVDWGWSLQKIFKRIHNEDCVKITFNFEKED